MNNELLLTILLVVLTLAVLVLLTIVIFVIFKMNIFGKDKEEDSANIKSAHSVTESFSCYNHPESFAVATCAICEEAICEHCHKDWNGLHLCPEHFGLYSKHQWIEIAEIKTTPNEPEKGHKLYHFKQSLWSDEKIPMYLVTHYKIDVDGDFVESWVKLYAREEESNHLLTRYKVHSH